MIRQVDHIAIAVPELDRARAFFVDALGARQVWSAPMPGAGFRWTTLEWGAGCMIELINPEVEEGEPDEGMVQRFLARRGPGAHHITLQVDDLAAVRERLIAEGVPFFGYGEPLPGWKELFVHPRDAFGILLQFAQFDPFQWIPPGEPVPATYRAQAPAGAQPEVEVSEIPGGVLLQRGWQRLELPRDQVAALAARLRDLEGA